MTKLVRLSDETYARLARLIGQLHIKRGQFVSVDEAVVYSLDKCGVHGKAGKRVKKVKKPAQSSRKAGKKRG